MLTMISLRGLKKDDIEQLRIWRNDLYKHFRQYKPISETEQIRWYNETKDIMFAVCDNGKLIGCAGLCYIDLKNRSADLSIYIGKTYIDDRAEIAIKLLFDYGFKELGLERIYNDLFEYDILKHDMLLSCGMKVEGVARNKYYRDGQFYNAKLYSILRSEYDFGNGESVQFI